MASIEWWQQEIQVVVFFEGIGPSGRDAAKTILSERWASRFDGDMSSGDSGSYLIGQELDPIRLTASSRSKDIQVNISGRRMDVTFRRRETDPDGESACQEAVELIEDLGVGSKHEISRFAYIATWITKPQGDIASLGPLLLNPSLIQEGEGLEFEARFASHLILSGIPTNVWVRALAPTDVLESDARPAVPEATSVSVDLNSRPEKMPGVLIPLEMLQEGLRAYRERTIDVFGRVKEAL